MSAINAHHANSTAPPKNGINANPTNNTAFTPNHRSRSCTASHAHITAISKKNPIALLLQGVFPYVGQILSVPMACLHPAADEAQLLAHFFKRH